MENLRKCRSESSASRAIRRSVRYKVGGEVVNTKAGDQSVIRPEVFTELGREEKEQEDEDYGFEGLSAV